MEHSANLQLPYIMPSQAQKHVTHNEAIRTLDALVQLTVLDRDLSTPPGSPPDGARYLVAAGGTDAWTGKDGTIAAWQDGAWAFLAPKAGWLLWVADETRLLGFDGAEWIDAAVHSVNPAPMVGVNATADTVNRLAVKSPASLFDEETGDHRMKINKAAAGDTASLIFQSGYSGRAEFGLAGDDDWHVKVSADGSVWTEALTVDRATGRVRLPAALSLGDENQVVTQRHVREKLGANRTYYVRPDGSDSNDGQANNAGGAFLTLQKAIDTVAALDISTYNVAINVADGTYTAGVTLNGPWVGTGTVTITGNTTTPANCLIQLPGSGACVTVTNSGRLRIGGFKFVTSGGIGLYANTYGTISLSGAVDFGASNTQVWCTTNATISLLQNYAISGGGATHFNANTFGTINSYGRTLTISGTPVFSSSFILAQFFSFAYVFGNTYSGSATGARYSVATNSIINTGGGGATYLPGSSGGSTATQGQYL